MNIEEAKKIIEEWDIWNKENNICTKTILAIRTFLSELEKKDKVINEMAEYIKQPYRIIAFGSRQPKVEIIKEYFTNKVEREGK